KPDARRPRLVAGGLTAPPRAARLGSAGARAASSPAALPLAGKTIGILALQGDVRSHAELLESLGAAVRKIRGADGLPGLDGLVLPGGESTTMTLAIAREGLDGPLREAIAGGLPVLATCAGLILL